MVQQKLNHGLDAPLHAAGAMRVMLGDVVEVPFELTGCRPREAQPHKPCFAQMARISVSVAKSPRASAASASSSSAASSGDSL